MPRRGSMVLPAADGVLLPSEERVCGACGATASPRAASEVLTWEVELALVR